MRQLPRAQRREQHRLAGSASAYRSASDAIIPTERIGLPESRKDQRG